MKSKYLKLLFIGITCALVFLVIFINIGKKQVNAENKIEYNSSVDDITFNDKVNIYFFWGNGCPHCKEESAFFNKIYNDYSQYFNIYSFEVWYNESNASLMQKFAKELDETPKGVPYLIIGNKSFVGFNSSMEDSIKEEIVNQYNNKTKDIYQDILSN